MTQPKYTENPMAFLRAVVAHATYGRISRLDEKAKEAKRLAEIAQDELDTALAEAENGTFNDIDCLAICTGDSDCWAYVCRRALEIDNGEQWGPFGQRVHAHPADREDSDVAMIVKIFPDFNPEPGIMEGLGIFKANK